MKLDSVATVPQKAPVTVGPRTKPPGSCGLVERTSAIHLNGFSHWVFVFGPVGPLL